MTIENIDGKEYFLTNLQKTHDFCPESGSFCESNNFLQKIIANINESRLKIFNTKTAGDTFNNLSLSTNLFNNENQLKNFEKMFNGLRRTKDDIMNSYAAFKEFEGKDFDLVEHLIDFLRDFKELSGIKKIDKFIVDIEKKGIKDFPIFVREMFDFFDIDFIYEEENSNKGFPEVDFLHNGEKFENYKNFFFLLKVVENTLIFLNNDFQFSNVIENYNKKRVGGIKNNGNGNNKRDKKLLEDNFINTIYKFKKYYINTVFGERSIRHNKETINFSVELETNVRFKTIKSLINKGLVGGYDPNNIHDIFGCFFHIKLPELEEKYQKDTKQKKLYDKIKEEKYKVLKEIISFLPSIVKNNRSMDIRIRDYLNKEKTNKSSGETYKAIHITFSKFQLNHYEFPIPIECKIMMEDSPHDGYKNRQCQEIINNFFLNYNIKDFWGYLIFYYILLQRGDGNFNMFKFSDDIVEEVKTKDQILKENQTRIFNLIVDSFSKMDKKLFERIIKDDLMEKTFSKFNSKEGDKKQKKNRKNPKEDITLFKDLRGSFHKNVLGELKKYFEENSSSEYINDCEEKIKIIQSLLDQ